MTYRSTFARHILAFTSLSASAVLCGCFTPHLVATVKSSQTTATTIVDTTGPLAPTGLTLGSVPNDSSLSPTLTFTAASDGTGVGTSFHQAEVRLASDNSSIASWSTLVSGNALSSLSLLDGVAYYFNLRGVDLYGNLGTSATSSNWTASTRNGAHTIGSTAAEQFYGVAATSDGGWVAVGKTASYGAGNTDGWIAKYSASGSVSWSYVLGGTAADAFTHVAVSSTGKIYVSGETQSFGAGTRDAWVSQFESDGTLNWSIALGSTSFDEGRRIIATSDGGAALVAQQSIDTGAGEFAITGVLFKLTAAGSVSWTRRVGDPTDEAEATTLHGLTELSDGSFVAVGEYDPDQTSTGGEKGLILKTDSAGAVSWLKTFYDNLNRQQLIDVVAVSGGYVIVGSTTFKSLAMKVNTAGTSVDWETTLDVTGNETSQSAALLQDGNILIAGAGNSKALVSSLDPSSGSTNWIKSVSNGTTNSFSRAVQLTNRSILAVGSSNQGAGSTDGWIAQLRASGTITGTCAACTTPTPTAATLNNNVIANFTDQDAPTLTRTVVTPTVNSVSVSPTSVCDGS